MANYYADWRSNYFKVKDEAKFVGWVETLPCTDFQEKIIDGEKYFMICEDYSGDSNGIPCFRFTEDDHVELDIFDELSKHLRDDSVAVIMEVGAEKLRYLIGESWAVRSDGKVKRKSIRDIYDYIEKVWKKTPTKAEY